jgi:hypothetical protein
MKGESLDTRPFRFCQKCWLFVAHERFLLLRSEDTLQKRISRGERHQLGLASVLQLVPGAYMLCGQDPY